MATNNAQTFTIGGVTHQVEDTTARAGVASLQTALASLQSALDTLMGTDDITDEIDTYNEIKEFLDGFDVNDPNLSEQLTTLFTNVNDLVAAMPNKASATQVNNLQTAVSNLQTALADKVDAVNGKGLSTNDYTDADKAAVATIANKANSADVYPKSQTYNKDEVDTKVANAQGTQGPKGDTGNVEITDAGDLVTILVNDLDTGGAGNILSAEMGKRLALKSGTFAQAWARSKAIPFPFCFLWNETIDGNAISKPIWHNGNSVFVDAAGAIVSVEAAAVPAAPTITGATNGSTVPKNTQITITPASGSALYYSLDGGTTYNVSDAAVTIKLETAGNVSIVAYCANNKGNSASNATLSVTVAGTAVPTFSPDGGEVSRGGSVTISVPTGGVLHYKVDSGSWITASGTSVSVPVTGSMTIQAYNVQDGDTSDTITKSFTLAALASPTFSVATGTEFPATGGSVGLTGPAGASIYYTTDGSTPTTASTLYSGAIAVASAMTIKAIAHDTYGDSAVAEASYTVVQPKMVVTATDATTMSLGESGLTAIPITAGDNEFTIADINTIGGTNYTSFADHVFPSLSFGDKTKISEFDGGGIHINSLADAFKEDTSLTSCVGIVLDGNNAHAESAFKECTYLTACELSGIVNGSMSKAFNVATGGLTALDISGLSGHITDCGSMFMGVGCEKIDVSQFTFTKDKAVSMFRGCNSLKTLKVGKIDETGDSYANLMFMGTTGIKTLICTETTPYATGWLSSIGSGLQSIYVPDASVNDYKAHSEWGTYASIIKGISEYTE